MDEITQEKIHEEQSPNYNYKKVWKYIRLFQRTQELSNGYLQRVVPNEYKLPEGVEVSDEDKKKFIVPTPLSIRARRIMGHLSPEPTPILYVLIMDYDIQLREQNGFMYEFTKHIKQKSSAYQREFGDHVNLYAKNRLLNTLAEHEQWKALAAPTLYIQLEDYIKAYIAAQILFPEE